MEKGMVTDIVDEKYNVIERDQTGFLVQGSLLMLIKKWNAS